MHPAADSAQPQTPIEVLELINQLLPLLLLSSLSVKSFVGRWQVIRTKLTSLRSSVSDISDCPHWSENPLLHDLLPNLLSTLHKTKSLSDLCHDSSSYTGGKLLLQSDLDMASASLSSILHDLDLLLKSGVLRQTNAIVLSQPGPGSGKEELGFFIRDLFARLQIGGIEFKKKALDSLLQLLREDDKAAVLVPKEGDVGCLVHLLDSSNPYPSVREQAALAVSLLATASDSSRNCVFEEGGLGPLLRLLETGSSGLKEKAAMAVEAITADLENAWAISAYGGVPVLVEACRSGSPVTQMHAAGAIKNVVSVEDIRLALAEEGVVPVLVQLLISGTGSAQEKAAGCLWMLASSGEDCRVSIQDEGGLQRLLQLLQESTSPDTIEQVLRAIYALSASASAARILSSSSPFLMRLFDLIKNGNLTVQQISASLLANLSVSDGSKRAMAGCMTSLVRMLESSKPAGLQDVAAQALVSLLTVRSNRKELARDEKSVLRLVQMLDPRNESVCKKLPVAVISAILAGSGKGSRKRIAAAGAFPHLQKLADIDVAGAKKALHRLSGNRIKNIFTRTWKE